MKSGRGADPVNGSSRLSELMDRDSADALGGVLYHGASQGHRSGGAGQRHADDFRGHSRGRQVNQILRGELGPVAWRRRAYIEDGRRMAAQQLSPPAVDG